MKDTMKCPKFISIESEDGVNLRLTFGDELPGVIRTNKDGATFYSMGSYKYEIYYPLLAHLDKPIKWDPKLIKFLKANRGI